MENLYFVDLKAKIIQIPNQRWYEFILKNKPEAFPSVTTIQGVKSKAGLTNWQINIAKTGVDPKQVSQEAMNQGSRVHEGIESLLFGNKLSFLNPDNEENYDFFGEWLPLGRFIEAQKELEIKPILIEQNVFSLKHKAAGTLDLLAGITVKGKRHLAVIDHKRSAGVYPEYQSQVAAYLEFLKEMVQNNYFPALTKKITDAIKDISLLDTAKPYILLLNVATKKGWRLTEVTEVETKFELFKACNALFRLENPNLQYVKELYPMSLKIEK